MKQEVLWEGRKEGKDDGGAEGELREGEARRNERISE